MAKEMKKNVVAPNVSEVHTRVAHVYFIVFDIVLCWYMYIKDLKVATP